MQKGEKGERNEKGEGRREKGEGRREKGEGKREKGEGRRGREKGEGRKDGRREKGGKEGEGRGGRRDIRSDVSEWASVRLCWAARKEECICWLASRMAGTIFSKSVRVEFGNFLVKRVPNSWKE
jgi:hypothetical protein